MNSSRDSASASGGFVSNRNSIGGGSSSSSSSNRAGSGVRWAGSSGSSPSPSSGSRAVDDRLNDVWITPNGDDAATTGRRGLG